MKLETLVPSRMAHLERDHRGYPIPVIVMRTTDGRAHFTVNDHAKVEKCAKNKLCNICGKRLRKSECWFVGGPMSAFHAHGAYIDGPVHHECGTFALQTCPYLAAPNYNRKIDGATIAPGTLEDDTVVLTDPTMMPERPELFIFACAADFKTAQRPGTTMVHIPKRPWIMYEFWCKGEKITPAQAVPLVQANFARHNIST